MYFKSKHNSPTDFSKIHLAKLETTLIKLF